MGELIGADGKMPQCFEAGNLLYFTQTVAVKVHHLDTCSKRFTVRTGNDVKMKLL